MKWNATTCGLICLTSTAALCGCAHVPPAPHYSGWSYSYIVYAVKSDSTYDAGKLIRDIAHLQWTLGVTAITTAYPIPNDDSHQHHFQCTLENQAAMFVVAEDLPPGSVSGNIELAVYCQWPNIGRDVSKDRFDAIGRYLSTSREFGANFSRGGYSSDGQNSHFESSEERSSRIIGASHAQN